MTEADITVVACYYDVRTSNETVFQKCSRCVLEMEIICHQLDIIAQYMHDSVVPEIQEDFLLICHFQYENYLYRIYAIRERAWDVLSAITDTKRENTGTKSFRETVIAKLQILYSDIHKSFERISRLIDEDVQTRNVVTHQTFLFFGIDWSEDKETIYDMLDVMGEDNIQFGDNFPNQNLIKKAFRDFIMETGIHIDEVMEATRDFIEKVKTQLNEDL